MIADAPITFNDSWTIDARYRGRGLSVTLYRNIAADLAGSGRVLERSPNQTPMGRAMWRGFERQGLVRGDTFSPTFTRVEKLLAARRFGMKLPSLAIAAASLGTAMAFRAQQEQRARARAVASTVTVRGHYTRDGTYVRQHTRRLA